MTAQEWHALTSGEIDSGIRALGGSHETVKAVGGGDGDVILDKPLVPSKPSNAGRFALTAFDEVRDGAQNLANNLAAYAPHQIGRQRLAVGIANSSEGDIKAE